MRTFISFAALLFAVPALAAEPAAPASPPPVSYEVWGFQWNGNQYIQQPTYILKTTDLKQASDYATQLNSYAGWTAATNMPDPVYVHTVYRGREVINARPPAQPEPVSFAVWAFKLTDGKWLKSDQYSWSTPDPVAAVQYAQQVSAVAGWRATSNAPPAVPLAQRFVNGGPMQGVAASRYQYIHLPSISVNGMTINWPNMTIRVPRGYHWSSGSNDSGSGYDLTQQLIDDANRRNDEENLRNSQALQDAQNQQQMLNNEQDLINQQNFQNTENMINSQQDAINAQQMANPNP